MNSIKWIILSACQLACVFLFAQKAKQTPSFDIRAQGTLDSIYRHYGVEGSNLLRENFPFDDNYQASYLGTDEPVKKGNPYSYLWPFSGSFSAQVALYESKKDKKVLKEIISKTIPGLESYYDKRNPNAYASYINTARESDRFYDDNIWLGIDFTDLYLLTKNKDFLVKAVEIWKFIESGMDDKLGGGIYWCEQRKDSKNTCSNAPGTVYLVKLYEATKDKKYLELAKSLYAWTKSNLQDPTDKIYFDNIQLSGKIGKAKFPYNTGQMIQAAALLYKVTKEKPYLNDAQEVAKAAYSYFFHPESNHDGNTFKLLKNSDLWFIAVMMRGFVELYHLDNNPTYVQTFKSNLDYAWYQMRDEHGLFNKDWSMAKKSKKKWLLDQFATAEMFARFSILKK